MSFSQSYLPSEDHGTLSVSHWIHRELRKIKLGDHGAKRLKKTVCIAEVRMPWLPIVSVYHNTIGGVLRDSELLNRDAKQVRITFGHDFAFRGSGCTRRHLPTQRRNEGSWSRQHSPFRYATGPEKEPDVIYVTSFQRPSLQDVAAGMKLATNWLGNR